MTGELACISSEEEIINRNMHTKTCINTEKSPLNSDGMKQTA